MGTAGRAPMIVFTDLDGTLLDHDTYDWQPAREALETLKSKEIPVVLVSSKTLAELEDYRSQLELEHPVVAENGAVVDIPPGYFSPSVSFSAGTVSRAELQSAYQDVREAGGYACQAFFELGTAGIVRETGLAEAQAQLANDRLGSEPILWLDTDERALEFEREMAARGLRCIRGGRFLHLMGKSSKERAVAELIAAYAEKWPQREIASVSLGDGPNDLGMLATTDIAVVIPGKHPHGMTLESQNRILRPEAPGPAGWNAAMLKILAEQFDES